MEEKKLTHQTINDIISRVAKKTGIAEDDQLTYKQRLLEKLQNAYSTLNEYSRRRLQTPEDFVEEIQAYLADNITNLLSQGYSVEESVELTMKKLSETKYIEGDITPSDSMGDNSRTEWFVKNSEAIGMYYAAFMTLGMSLGAFFGFQSGGNLTNAGIGLLLGLGIGTSLGLLAQALLATFKPK